jgi:flagellar motor switch protein FliN/FliY
VAGPAVAAPAAVDEALAAAAGAACDVLPANGEWSGQAADGSAPAAPGAGAPAVADHEFVPLPAPAGPSAAAAGRSGPIELLHEVEMGVTVELGRTRLLVRDILDLSPGSVIELDRAAGAPIDVLVNGTLIARGEVVVIDEEFGIRITEVIGYQSR